MLRSLYISSFVIVDKIQIDFYDGMSVLTGETGAGKSIIIDAIGQLCGNRSSNTLVKKNASKAVIEGIFDVAISEELEALCDELNIELDDNIIITKEIYDNGKSNIKINYRNSTNHALKMLSPYLIDIHSQFETQKIFEEKNHLVLLDEYASKRLNNIKEDYHDAYHQYKDSLKLLNQTINEDMSDEHLEFLTSQLEEIESYFYSDEEVESMENELKILKDYEKLNERITNFDSIMNSSNGVIVQFKEALRSISTLSDYEDFNDSYEKLYDISYMIKEEYESIMNTYRSFDFDEYRFNELSDILFNVNRLKRKYGFSMKRIEEYKNEISESIARIENREQYILNLQKQVNKQKDECMKLAKKIQTIRKEAAKEFENDIVEELKTLYLDKAIFKVEFNETDLSINGIDKVQFKVALNKGQDLSLLNESASGGEISRIMLAIKTIIFSYNKIDTIVFDEVDTGVSGKVASAIGEKMKKLAKNKQVICITHLPQVASLASYHYQIEKNSSDETTVTSMKQLTQEERVTEIAKMLSGETITKEAIENAKQLLNA